MKKGYVIGGLAVLGAIALFAWYSSPKKNKDGFYSADGGCNCNSNRPTGMVSGTGGRG